MKCLMLLHEVYYTGNIFRNIVFYIMLSLGYDDIRCHCVDFDNNFVIKNIDSFVGECSN